MLTADDHARLRREALQIAIQLPADRAEAIAVLRYTREILLDFLLQDDSEATVIRLRKTF
jgi:hypothetical protein